MSGHGKSRKQAPGHGSQVATGSVSRKSNPAASTITKSKYGGVRTTIYAGSRTNVLSSASRKSLGTQGQSGERPAGARVAVQVFDEGGNDVTPLPLFVVDPNMVKKNQSNILGDSSGGTPTDLMSQASIYNTGTVTASTFGGGPFTRSVFSQSYDTGTDSMAEDTVEPSADLSSAWADIRHKREEVKEVLNEDDLEKIVNLTLTETETIWLLDVPGICVSTESDEAGETKAKNDRYTEMKKNRAGNDRYAERGMNTFNEPPKLKTVQTTKVQYNEVGIMATTWDMYDTFEQQEKDTKAAKSGDDDEEGTISRPSSPKEGEAGDATAGDTQTPDVDTPAIARESSNVRIDKAVATQLSESRATMSSSVAGSESVFASKETGVSSMPSEMTAIDEDKILKSENFIRDMFIMERVINLNTYQPKQALYRDFPIIQDIDLPPSSQPAQQLTVSDMGPNFDRLWAYTCPLTKGRNVSMLSWNKLNPDLIAIAYGQFEFSNQKGGLICCWSLKNPEFPERVYTCKEGVTAVDFSVANPSLLAVGLYDGGVAIYNVRNTEDESILDNFESPGKHTAPVWQIKWIMKERGSGDERAEVLVSISTDGRVTQWSIRKGFESYDLMRLKRMPTKFGGKKERKGEAFISRHAGGLGFDFHSHDSNIYLAGTEEGHIHKCSCSYNEQYLDSFVGHMGPVYKIQWSPFVSDVFLSCGSDWSIRLWHQERPTPVLNFFSSTKPVYDVTWSPRSSTVFACVNEGAVEVWDLSISTLDPIIVNNPTQGAKQTAVTFAKNSECILVGDSEGQVTVYQLRSMPEPPENQEDALTNVMKASLASQLQPSSTGQDEEDLEDDDLGLNKDATPEN